MIDYAGLMTKAAMLRKKFGEDDSSPIDIFAIAQSVEGLTMVFYPMGDNLSGMCIKGQDNKCVIAINSSMTLGRQRFSLAHEFYHLYYDDNMISVCEKRIESGGDVEKTADMFASYFLMPDAALLMMARKYAEKNDNGKVSLDNVIRIEQFYGVSHQAAVFRLVHTPFLNNADKNKFLNMSVRSRAESLGFSSDLYRPSSENKRYMTYGNYINQVEELYAERLISNGKYEELLLDAFRTDLVYGDEEEGGDIID